MMQPVAVTKGLRDTVREPAPPAVAGAQADAAASGDPFDALMAALDLVPAAPVAVLPDDVATGTTPLPTLPVAVQEATEKPADSDKAQPGVPETVPVLLFGMLPTPPLAPPPAPVPAPESQPAVSLAARADMPLAGVQPGQPSVQTLPADKAGADVLPLPVSASPVPVVHAAAADAGVPVLSSQMAPLMPLVAPQDTVRPPVQWAPLALPSHAPEQWSPVLQHVLGERLQIQAEHGIQNAVIRLDPPMLGSLQIEIRHQAGQLQVNLVASNPDVARQLQHASEHLRQDLLGGQFNGVSVSVAQGGTSDAGQGGRRQAFAGEAATPAIGEAAPAAHTEAGSHASAFLMRV